MQQQLLCCSPALVLHWVTWSGLWYLELTPSIFWWKTPSLASCPFSTPLVFCFIRTPLTLLNFSNKHDLSCLHPKQATRPVKTPWKKCVEKSESCQTVNCTTCLPLELWKQKPRHWQTPRAHFLSKDTSTGDFRDRLKQNHNLVLNNS